MTSKKTVARRKRKKKKKGNGLPRLSLGYSSSSSSVFFLFILYSFLLSVIGNRAATFAPFAIACLAADFSFALSISLSCSFGSVHGRMDGTTDEHAKVVFLAA